MSFSTWSCQAGLSEGHTQEGVFIQNIQLGVWQGPPRQLQLASVQPPGQGFRVLAVQGPGGPVERIARESELRFSRDLAPMGPFTLSPGPWSTGTGYSCYGHISQGSWASQVCLLLPPPHPNMNAGAPYARMLTPEPPNPATNTPFSINPTP